MIEVDRVSSDNPLLHAVEMKSTTPPPPSMTSTSVQASGGLYCDVRNCSAEQAHAKRQEYVGQIPIPWVPEKTGFNPGFLKCDGKIVKYDSKGLAIWRVSFPAHIRYSFFTSVLIGISKCISYNYL
jgi:hypothetical protein